MFETECLDDILFLPPMSFRKTSFLFSSLFLISMFFQEYLIASIFWGISSMFVTLMVTSTMYNFPEDELRNGIA